MKTLVFDFLRRWWLLVVVIAVNAITGLLTGRAPLLPLMIIGLIADSQRGVMRATRTLPVPWRTQARGWWFVSVPLGAVIGLLLMPLALLVSPLIGTVAPWFGIAYGWWVGLGFSSLAFLSFALCPNGPAEDVLGLLKRIIAGLGSLLAFPGYMFLLAKLPMHVEELTLWSQALAAIVPFLVLWSWLAAPGMPSRRINGGLDLLLKPKRESSPVSGNAPSGLTALIRMMHGRPLMVLVVFGVMSYAMFQFMGLDTQRAMRDSTVQWVSMSALFCMFFIDQWNLRSLRSLPMSTGRLAGLIVSVPVAQGLACGGIRAALLMLAGGPPMALSCLAMAAVVGSVGTLVMVVALYFSSVSRFVILPVVLIPLSYGAVLMSHLPPAGEWMLVGVSSLLVMAGWGMIWHGLLKSSAFYVSRQIPGWSWATLNSQS